MVVVVGEELVFIVVVEVWYDWGEFGDWWFVYFDWCEYGLYLVLVVFGEDVFCFVVGVFLWQCVVGQLYVYLFGQVVYVSVDVVGVWIVVLCYWWYGFQIFEVFFGVVGGYVYVGFDVVFVDQ